MLPTRNRRPRPPGIRRAPLRTLDGEAPPLPLKIPLDDNIPSLKGKEKASPSADAKLAAKLEAKLAGDHYTASPVRPPMRNRPLSMLSEVSSLTSPPPPYRPGSILLPSPDRKTAPVGIPPPPPDALESGPSSVRTSMMEVENMLDEDDDDEPGNTLTLRGVQKLIRQHDIDTMADTLSTRLQPFESPDASLPAIFNMYSPVRSPPIRPDGSPRLRTVPSDPTLSFSFARPRIQNMISAKDERELRLAAARAEEDEARIAALEEQLAEARDSEEAQRKSAARLRRDVAQLRRQLEHAEEAAADRERVDLSAFAERERSIAQPESVDSWRLAAATSVRPRGSYGPPADDDVRLGWGATAFPEYPREHAGSEAASESTTRPLTRDPSPVSDDRGDSILDDASAQLNDGADEPLPAALATLVIPAKSRPHISASTFLSPARDEEPRVPLTPTLMVEGTKCSGSPTVPNLLHKDSQASLRSRKSISSSRSYSSLSRASFSRLRTEPYPVRDKSPSEASTQSRHQRSGSCDSDTLGAIKEVSQSPLSTGLDSRMNSVRSFLSDYVGVNGRSLGSELGSNFRLSPMKDDSSGAEDSELSISALPVEVSDALNTLALACAQKTPVKTPSRRGRSCSTVSFHLRGSLVGTDSANAYDSVLDAPRHIRFADIWSPESKATPTPSPRAVPNASDDTWSSTSEELSTLVPPILSHLTMPGAGPGRTPSPHVTTYLAPRNDPWDEYSDRPTPSPRLRHLRPLLLCSKPAVHARTCSLALARDRSSRGITFSGLSPARAAPQPQVVALKRPSPVKEPSTSHLPTTIPGRMLHDFFCLVLVWLEYAEWFVILFYRLLLDIRGGPGTDTVLSSKRRIHAKRFYV